MPIQIYISSSFLEISNYSITLVRLQHNNPSSSLQIKASPHTFMCICALNIYYKIYKNAHFFDILTLRRNLWPSIISKTNSLMNKITSFYERTRFLKILFYLIFLNIWYFFPENKTKKLFYIFALSSFLHLKYFFSGKSMPLFYIFYTNILLHV